MKEVKDITLLNEAMVRVARWYARYFGYIEIEDREVDVLKEDKFWGNVALATKFAMDSNFQKRFTYHKVLFVQPLFEDEKPEGKRIGKIEIDLLFGSPRLTVYYPSYIKTGEMVNLTYDPETLEFQESQVWGKNGFDYGIYLKGRVDGAIAKLKSSQTSNSI